MRIALAVACAIASGCSTWQPAEQRAFAFAATCQAVDLMQTDDALESGGFVEGNPIIGKRPSDNQLIAFKTAAIVATWSLAEWVEPEARWKAIMVSTIPCLIAVGHNYSAGARP